MQSSIGSGATSISRQRHQQPLTRMTVGICKKPICVTITKKSPKIHCCLPFKIKVILDDENGMPFYLRATLPKHNAIQNFGTSGFVLSLRSVPLCCSMGRVTPDFCLFFVLSKSQLCFKITYSLLTVVCMNKARFRIAQIIIFVVKNVTYT